MLDLSRLGFLLGVLLSTVKVHGIFNVEHLFAVKNIFKFGKYVVHSEIQVRSASHNRGISSNQFSSLNNNAFKYSLALIHDVST